MDDKKDFKVEIEFDDDFDEWLKEHDVKPAPAPKPVVPPKPAAPQQPIEQHKPAQPQPKPIRRVAREDFSSESKDGKSVDIPISRREAVRNFQLHIDESEYEQPVEQPVQQPENARKPDKAIYFAARQPSKAQLEHRRAEEKARQMRQKQEKQSVQQQRLKERRQINRLRRALIATVIVFMSALCATYAISCMNDVLALNRDSENVVMVTVDKGAGCMDIIDTLGDNKLIKHEWFCKLFAKFRNLEKNKKGVPIEYLNGVYYLTPSMGVEGMLNDMRQNQKSDETVRLYFPEGWTIQQIVNKLAENNVCPAEYIYTALKEVEYEFNFVNSIPKSNEKYFALEGYVFPDTYDFFVSKKKNGIGENPNSIVRKFLSNFETKWTEIYEKRAQELGLTMDEVITIASIIQKEAADAEQMRKVSSVIHNRLNNRADFPTLGCDSTKKYAQNYLSKVIGDANASAYINFYDTNSVRSGLPAGPICNPGIAAIEAALNPDDTDYYYFCHNEKGKIYLAKTYKEFQANWAQVLKDNEGLNNDN